MIKDAVVPKNHGNQPPKKRQKGSLQKKVYTISHPLDEALNIKLCKLKNLSKIAVFPLLRRLPAQFFYLHR